MFARMHLMADETNWHKHVAIGTYILIGLTAILILLAILTFVYPPDPQHPISFDWWSKANLPGWLTLSLVLAAFVVGSVAGHRTWRRKMLRQQASSVPFVRITPVSLVSHPTSLDQRVILPSAGIGYTAKLRLSLENAGAERISVLAPRWITSLGNVSVQCGASPYPGIPYEEGMMNFSYRYQLEEYKGSWKADKWRRDSNGKDEELTEAIVEPNQTFRIWIGLNPCVPHKNLEDLRKTHNLGTLVLPIVTGNITYDWSVVV